MASPRSQTSYPLKIAHNQYQSLLLSFSLSLSLSLSLPLLLCLSSFPSVAKRVCARKNHQFGGAVLDVQRYQPPKGSRPSPTNRSFEEAKLLWVQVDGLPERVTVDQLEIYFQSKRSGGKEGAVKDVWLDAKRALARIAFSEQDGKAYLFPGSWIAHFCICRYRKFRQQDRAIAIIEEKKKPRDGLFLSDAFLSKEDVFRWFFSPLKFSLAPE